jgi:hypothetical protein
MRLILASMLLAGGVLAWPMSTVAVRAEPETCPPVCDQIPDTAWIRPQAIPLSLTYRWPSPATVAVPVTGKTPRFRFEDICAPPSFAQDTRDSAVAARAVVINPQGQWHLQAQVLHWRGDTARGGANVDSVFDVAAAALRGCRSGTAAEWPSVTAYGPNRLAAAISGPTIMHTYLVAHPQSSTISELTLWSSAPPLVPWPAGSDEQVLDAMTTPLCAAYLGSCE